MHRHWLGAALALAAAMIAHNVGAQAINSCPAGQVVQGSDASGRHISCVPLPDVSGLQAQIDAERTAREGMDVILQDAIDELHPSSIVGTYTFTGSQLCMSSTFGFNPDFTPVQAPPQDPNTGQVVSTVVATSSGTVSGTRTFNADGTGYTEFQTVAVNAPGFFYNVFGNGVTSAGAPNRPAGAASVSSSSGPFTWEVIGNKLIIREGGAPGVITKGGGNRNGWAVTVEDLPPFVGTLGTDLGTISITHEDIAVEVSVLRSPEGLPPQEFRSPRVCHRERTLRRVAS